ncbi:MAG: hypothetical protein LC798_16225 [Chloroflexi bacterium]|nr:hypothetical protein [Chloroflexota bacterium]
MAADSDECDVRVRARRRWLVAAATTLLLAGGQVLIAPSATWGAASPASPPAPGAPGSVHRRHVDHQALGRALCDHVSDEYDLNDGGLTNDAASAYNGGRFRSGCLLGTPG